MRLTKRKKSQKQEAQTARDLGGKTTIASGALVQKGDVFNDHFLVECKTTEKDFYSLKQTTWEKIRKEALNSSMRTPVMRIDISDSTSPLSWAVLREVDFTHLCYGMAVYVLDIESCNAKSFRITGRRPHYTNSDVIVGVYFDLLEDKSGLVQIKWDDFMTLYDKNYN